MGDTISNCYCGDSSRSSKDAANELMQSVGVDLWGNPDLARGTRVPMNYETSPMDMWKKRDPHADPGQRPATNELQGGPRPPMATRQLGGVRARQATPGGGGQKR